MLTQHLSGELAPKILVNAIAPGFFPSKMTKVLMSAGEEAVGAALPLKRVGQSAPSVDAGNLGGDV